jgi:hypothetical protein
MWRLTPAVKRDDADDFGIAEPGACALYAKLGASLSGRRVTRQNRTPDGMAEGSFGATFRVHQLWD